jgi:hypothetical protein
METQNNCRSKFNLYKQKNKRNYPKAYVKYYVISRKYFNMNSEVGGYRQNNITSIELNMYMNKNSKIL